MILTPRHADALRRLLEKSRVDEVNWQPAPSRAEGAYVVRFPRSGIAVQYHVPRTAVDWISIDFQNEREEPAQRFRVEEGDSEWEIARALYAEAERSATGADEILADIEQAIARPGKIGVRAEKAEGG